MKAVETLEVWNMTGKEVIEKVLWGKEPAGDDLKKIEELSPEEKKRLVKVLRDLLRLLGEE